eukprot:3466862-Alexandrium_andersonii.AAC.1
MSASLVGSEMCIRDRPPTAAKRSNSCGAAAKRCGRSAGLRARHRTPCSTCLLYTSDAADDM